MKKNVWLVIVFFCVAIFCGSNLWAKTGKWELEAQYGIWTIRPALGVMNDGEWKISGEKNLGVALRLKPKQSFSLGLVYQKIQGNYSVSNSDSEDFSPYQIFWINDKQVKVVSLLTDEQENISMAGEMVLIDMRWEIASDWRVHPYFTLGFGAIFHDISESYYSSRTVVDTKGNHILMDEDNEGWDMENFPSVLPVLELKFGLKIEIIKKKLALGIEGGFMDGLVYAGTLNFRF